MVWGDTAEGAPDKLMQEAPGERQGGPNEYRSQRGRAVEGGQD